MDGLAALGTDQADNRRITFDDVTAPVGRDRFLSAYWTRQGVHLRQAERTFGNLFGWDGLNAILNAHDLAFPQLKMSRAESPIPPEAFTSEAEGHRLVDRASLVDLVRSGASFGITGADSHWPPLRSVIDALYDVLLESVHANVYCSPPHTQGFHCHYDLHEVFVLQIEGEKRWKVFWPTSDAPVQSWRAEDAPTASEPYVDVVLQKGDVLYVPRGHWHYATALDSISVHVTAGVTCHKGTAFMDWLSSNVVDRLEWRQNRPIMEAATSNGALTVPPAFVEWVDGLKRSLLAELAEPDLHERFWQGMFDDIRPRPNVHLPIDARLDIVPLETLVFDRPAGRQHLIRGNGDSIVISTGGCEFALEATYKTLVDRIFEADTFAVADIQKWQPTVNIGDVSDLLRELLRSGLLTARSPRQIS